MIQNDKDIDSTEDNKPKRKGFTPATKGEVRSPRGRNPMTEENLKKKLRGRTVKEKELMALLRKVKPHIAESVMTAARIMKNPQAQHQHQLKAATILLDAYRNLVHDVHDAQEAEDYEDAGSEDLQVQEDNSPIFSLKVINE